MNRQCPSELAIFQDFFVRLIPTCRDVFLDLAENIPCLDGHWFIFMCKSCPCKDEFWPFHFDFAMRGRKNLYVLDKILNKQQVISSFITKKGVKT
jgi:hypothetical protein